jgi:hypothetical protein
VGSLRYTTDYPLPTLSAVRASNDLHNGGLRYAVNIASRGLALKQEPDLEYCKIIDPVLDIITWVDISVMRFLANSWEMTLKLDPM